MKYTRFKYRYKNRSTRNKYNTRKTGKRRKSNKTRKNVKGNNQYQPRRFIKGGSEIYDHNYYLFNSGFIERIKQLKIGEKINIEELLKKFNIPYHRVVNKYNKTSSEGDRINDVEEQLVGIINGIKPGKIEDMPTHQRKNILYNKP